MLDEIKVIEKDGNILVRQMNPFTDSQTKKEELDTEKKPTRKFSQKKTNQVESSEQ